MKIPPYFKQENQATCSLAVLRMALYHFGIQVTETDLSEQVYKDYGTNFFNIWNPTIVKLACEYGLDTTFSAKWPLLKPKVLPEALKEYKENRHGFNANKYENQKDKEHLPEPLPLAYKEMFSAIEKGCQTKYGSLTAFKIKQLLRSEALIQTTIKLDFLYPGVKKAFHSILIYQLDGNTIYYHDPFRGKSLHCSLNQLLKATTDVGAFISYRQQN